MLERNRGTENFDLPRRWKKDFDVHDRFEIVQEEPRGNPQRSFDYGTHMGIGSILMSKIIFSATLALVPSRHMGFGREHFTLQQR